MAEPANMWSKGNPALQRAWDATSLGALMFCPTYYNRTIREGWRAPGSNVHLDFGGMFASAVETYKRRRIAGDSRDEAQLAAVKYAFLASESFDEEGVWTPWGGAWVDQWHCTGTEPYRNEKGNRAKCPYSHVGKWFFGDHGPTCGVCGSPIEEALNWSTPHPEKDRFALLRLVTWYVEEQPRDRDSGLQPYAFPDGTAAVELPFRVPLPYQTPYGETYILAGYLDSLSSYGEDLYITDNKTTKYALTQTWKASFSPSVQFDTYDLVGSVLLPDLDIAGVLIEGAQTLATGANFSVAILHRTEDQREEWLAGIEYWLRQAEGFAASGKWPMNSKNCTFCELKPVCSLPARQREGFLEANYEKRYWNPLQER